jgi:hypothetical protein
MAGYGVLPDRDGGSTLTPGGRGGPQQPGPGSGPSVCGHDQVIAGDAGPWTLVVDVYCDPATVPVVLVLMGGGWE